MVYAPVTAKFPSSLVTVQDLGLFTNDAQLVITSPVAVGDTVINVNDASQFAIGMWVPIHGVNGLEILQITAVQLSPAQITVTRARDGTTAVVHNALEVGLAGVPAQFLNQLVAEVIALETTAASVVTFQTAPMGAPAAYPGASYLNKTIALRADNGGNNNAVTLLSLKATNQYDRPAISWWDYAGNMQAFTAWHTTNFSDGANHSAYEIKTTEQTLTGFKTRGSFQGARDEAAFSLDATSMIHVINSLGGVPTSTSLGLNAGMDFAISDAASTRTSPTARTVFSIVGKWGDRATFATVLDIDAFAYGQSGSLSTPGTQNVTFRIGRSLNTSGVKTVEFHRGAGLNDPVIKFNLTNGDFQWAGGVSGTTFLAAQRHANTAARTYTWQDVTGTVPLLEATQTWSGVQTFSQNLTVHKTLPSIILSDTTSANTGTVQINNIQIGTGIGLTYDVLPTSASGDASFRLFRLTSTTGPRLFSVFVGNGTATTSWQLDAADGSTTQSGNVTFRALTAFNMVMTHVATANRQVNFQDATYTVIGKDTVDVLTNKTYDTAGAGNSFSINGNAITGVTGAGAIVVLATSPTLITPVLGVATATSLNGLTITASTGTLTITNLKTLAVSNTLTFTGTDGSSVAFGTGGTVAYRSDNLSVFAATTSAQLAGIMSDETGGGALVFATSPTLVTPVLGAATATSINGLTITASSGTLTIANLKTATWSNTLTFTGTDGSSVAFGAGGTVAYRSDNLSVFAATTSAQLAGIISDETGTGALVFASTPTLVTPILGVATATSINKVTITAPATSATLTIADGKILTVSNTLTFTGTDASSVAFGTGGTVTYTSNNLSVFAVTTSAQLAGVMSDETGTGALVFATSPSLVTPVLGVASGTSLTLSSLTSGRVTHAGASGILTDSANHTWDNVNFRVTTAGATDAINGGYQVTVAGTNVGTLQMLGGSTAADLRYFIDFATITGNPNVVMKIFRNTTTTGNPQFQIFKGDGTNTTVWQVDSKALTVTYITGLNEVYATAGAGTQHGTGATQLQAWWGATPVVQTAGATDVLAGLVTIGLRAASANPPLNLGTGTLTAGTAVHSGDVTTTANFTFQSGTAFIGTFDHAITAARTWTYQDLTGILCQSGGTYTLLGAAPAFAATVTVPTTVARAHVFGSVSLTSSVTNAASITVQIETGVATGVYSNVQVLMLPANITVAEKMAFSFSVPPGRRFKFAQGGLGGTTETISEYNYTEM